MTKALEEQLQKGELTMLSFDERFGLLVDRELTECESRCLQRRLGSESLSTSLLT